MTNEARTRCERHGLVNGPDGTCVVCRRDTATPTLPLDASSPEPASGRVVPLLGVLAVVVVGAALFLFRAPSEDAVPLADPAAPTQRARTPTAVRTTEAVPTFVPPGRAVAAAAAPTASTSADDEPALRKRILERARADEVAAARRRVPITMYTTSWCGVCKSARAWLSTEGITFTERDVEHDESARRRQHELNPRGSVPTFDIDGEARVGFSPEGIRASIDRAAARSVAR